MKAITYSPQKIHDMIRKIQAIKIEIYKRNPRETGSNRLFASYFPFNMVYDHKGDTLVTPKHLYIESKKTMNNYELSLFGMYNRERVDIQIIKQETEDYNPVFSEIAPYLNPYLEKMDKLVSKHWYDLDLGNEKKREHIIKNLLR